MKKLFLLIGLVAFSIIAYFVKETTSPPKITEIKFSDSMSDGLYKSGDKIMIVVSFSDPVVVDLSKDKPIILLETGEIDRHASYISGSGTKNLNFEYTVLPGDTTIKPLPPFGNHSNLEIDTNKSFFTLFIKNTINRSKSIVKQIPIVGPIIIQLYRKSIFYPYPLNHYDHRLRLLKQDPSIIVIAPNTIKGMYNSVNAVLDMHKGIIFNYEFPLRDYHRILVDSSSPIHWKYHMISGNNISYCNAPCSPNLMIQTKRVIQIFAIDLDSDEDIDILSASKDSGIAWHENNNDKSFRSNKISDKLRDSRTVQASDIDNDNDIDIIAGGVDQIVWLENNGSENFIMHEIINSEELEVTQVFPADLDGDGDQDILAALQWKNIIAWYENTNSNNFTEHIISDKDFGAHDIFAIDLDQDQDLDLVSASIADHTVAWYENNGSQIFTKHIINSSAYKTTSVYAIDLDKDGDIDVLSDASEIDAIIWYENNGAENFTRHNVSINTDRAFGVFPIDLDKDGDIDILSASSSGHTITWHENDGFQNFAPHIITTQALKADSVYAFDIDNDDDIDVVSSSMGDHSITWYENHH